MPAAQTKISCYVVALTGGIASGKTAVSDRFEALGVPVVDTDRIAREVVEPGSFGLKRLVQAFGEAILDDGCSLNRRALRRIVFDDEQKRRKLESILHPLIADRARDALSRVTALYAVLVVPLLVESGRFDWVDRVLLVDVSVETQLARLMQRDDIDRPMAEAMIQSQASREQRQAIADDIILNEESLAELDRQVHVLHEKYRMLARSSR